MEEENKIHEAILSMLNDLLLGFGSLGSCFGYEHSALQRIIEFAYEEKYKPIINMAIKEEQEKSPKEMEAK